MNQLKTDLFTQNILIIIHIINDSLKLKKKIYHMTCALLLRDEIQEHE